MQHRSARIPGLVQNLASTPLTIKTHTSTSSSKTPVLAHILGLLDFWSCHAARTACREWCKVVNTLCDGQFRPLHGVFTNPSHPYIDRVVPRLRRHEASFMTSPSHDNIGTKNRELFVNFMVELQAKLVLGDRTLALAMNYIDRYMVDEQVFTSGLLTLGITAIFMATKFEEVDRIPLLLFVEVTDHSCTAPEIQAMELKILQRLRFRLASCTPLSFFQYLGCLPFEDCAVKHFGQYLIELSYLNREITMQYKPSQIAAAALFVSLEFLSPPGLATLAQCRHLIRNVLEYEPGDVAGAMAELRLSLQHEYGAHAPALKRKFSAEQYSCVATLFDMAPAAPAAAGPPAVCAADEAGAGELVIARTPGGSLECDL